MNYGPAHFHEDTSPVRRIIREKVINNLPEPVDCVAREPTTAQAAIMSLKDYTNCPKLEAIMEAVCFETGVSHNAFFSKRRQLPIVAARMVFYHLARKLTRKTFPEIGKFCNRDHSTAVHGSQEAEKRMFEIAPVAQAVMARLGVQQ